MCIGLHQFAVGIILMVLCGLIAPTYIVRIHLLTWQYVRGGFVWVVHKCICPSHFAAGMPDQHLMCVSCIWLVQSLLPCSICIEQVRTYMRWHFSGSRSKVCVNLPSWITQQVPCLFSYTFACLACILFDELVALAWAPLTSSVGVWIV